MQGAGWSAPLKVDNKLSFQRHVGVHNGEAIIEDYDEALDAFRCRWFGVVLDTRNRSGPMSLCFDHLIPRKTSRLATSSMLANSMKSDLGPEEFPPVLLELARHKKGAPFNKDIIRFLYWAERPLPLGAPLPPGLIFLQERTRAVISECDICGDPSYPDSIYCPRCRRFVFSGGHDHLPRVRALKRAWDPILRAFICYYTGIPLDFTNPKNPWHMTMEHRTPKNDNSQVVAASWVNAVKTALSEHEFWAVIMEYDRWKREGGQFNGNVVKYRYWNRAVRSRIVA